MPQQQKPNRRVRKAKPTVEQISHLEAASLAHIDYKIRIVLAAIAISNVSICAAVWYFSA